MLPATWKGRRIGAQLIDSSTSVYRKLSRDVPEPLSP